MRLTDIPRTLSYIFYMLCNLDDHEVCLSVGYNNSDPCRNNWVARGAVWGADLAELSTRPLRLTWSDQTHLLTDPTQPNPTPPKTEKSPPNPAQSNPWVNPTHGQLWDSGISPRNLRQEGCYQFCCLVNRGTMGVNSLPTTVIQQRRGCDLNPGPSGAVFISLHVDVSLFTKQQNWQQPS